MGPAWQMITQVRPWLYKANIFGNKKGGIFLVHTLPEL